MDSVRGFTELRGNQGRDGEEEGVLSVEPITMIVPPELQDLPETMALKGSASSSARGDGGNHPTVSSSRSSTEETPSCEEGMGDVVSSVSDRLVVGEWEGVTIPGRLSNLRKAPKDLLAGFKFKAALHHEVADCAPSISGYKRLKEMVRAYHIPKTILLRTGGQNERVCTVSQTGWIPMYADHFDAGLRFPLPGLVFDLLADYELALTQLTPNSIRFIIGFMLLCTKLGVPAKAIVFRSLFQCPMCPNSRGSKWYYLSEREKSQLFKNVRNKVARWKKQFIFVRDTRAERISNDLAAWLSEWRTPHAHINYPQLLPRDIDLKNQLLEYAKRESLIDLEALVTSEQLAAFGFVDVTNLFSKGIFLSYSMDSSQAAPRRGKRDSTSGRLRCLTHAARPIEDPTRHLVRRLSIGSRWQLPVHVGVHVVALATVRSPTAPSATARAAAEPASASDLVSGPRIAYPEGFSYVRAECQPAMVQDMHSFVPPADSKRAKAFVQQYGGQVAMIKLMDAFSYAVALFESEQGAHSQNNELSANCKQLAAEKASLVEDVNHLQGSEMANRAAAAESRADELANRNNELREELNRARAEKESGIQAARDEAAFAEERAKRIEAERDRALNELSSLRRQLVGSAVFQDAVAVASANVTTEIYNEIRGKVLHHRPDFPICKLAFFDGEDIDEQGKSLAPLADTMVRLRWNLNEEGVPVWPPSVLEEGEDPAGLPSFDGWVEGVPVAEQEPSSTPPTSQPAIVPASSLVNAPAPEPAARSPLARSLRSQLMRPCPSI
ncbi:hypothetical protein SLEP1_g44273 [Rubroshorea leprosula]|uniref:Transposase (putative) gypsy type domain-containing protein n=1 Tax=Rubroshorea leprosula TaxID=152421 RepID=A0AAV5LGB4_9ROSI|nr:hypothetical protein SLEP1_g44273 [Rubroshorea leprosula]